MNRDEAPARLRLNAALDGLAVTFRGMTARSDESNCPCHWGSAEELAQLKVPGLELDPDLLLRTWEAPDWTDHAAVLRRILPQFAAELVRGRVEPLGMEEAGRSFARGHWQRWPVGQATAVREFLHAWWALSLTDPDPTLPAYEVLALCAEASAELSPWLTVWAELRHPVADQNLAEAVRQWEFNLLGDLLPWHSRENRDEMCAELAAWLIRHAPDRLRGHGDSEELLHLIRLLGLPGPARWEDPHAPGC
jgi:hypothetical protein